MLWSLALRVAQPEVPFSLVDGACCVVVGCGLSVCMFFHMTNERSDAPDVPFRYPVGCDVGCIVSGLCVSSPHRFAWVRGLQCSGMLLWLGAGYRVRGIGSLPLLFLALEVPECPADMESKDSRSLSLPVVPLPSSSGANLF